MRGEFVRVFADDGLELHGLFCPPTVPQKNEIAVLHIHGFTGNFYEERFVDYIADRLTAQGCTFLTVNTRGHDYLSNFLKKTNTNLTNVEIGSAHEIFEECIHDIKAWMDFLQRRGYSNVIHEGTSLGTLKVVFYQHQIKDERVRGLVLVSPVDHIGLQRAALGDKYDEGIRIAGHMIEHGKSDEFMPMSFCPLWQHPIDAKTYQSAFGPDTRSGLFNFHNPNAGFEELSSIECPILATYGTVREAVVDDKVEHALSIIKKKAILARRCDTALIQGAPHDYLGYEKELSEIIANWIITVFLK